MGSLGKGFSERLLEILPCKYTGSVYLEIERRKQGYEPIQRQIYAKSLLGR